jgi:NADH-quinone oxidoreductase subunit J
LADLAVKRVQMIESVMFYSLAVVAVASALVVVTRTNPVAAALALVTVILSLAGLFALLSAPLVAVLQVLVYAGGIMVLVLFVLMTLKLRPRDLKPLKADLPFIGLTLAAVLGGALLPILLALASPTGPWAAAGPAVDASFGGIRAISDRLFTDALFAFEMLSLLLTSAIVGALVLTKRRL